MKTWIFLYSFDRRPTDRCFLYACCGNPKSLICTARRGCGPPSVLMEVSHADQEPLELDHTRRVGLVGRQLPTPRGVPGFLYRAFPGAAVAAHRRPDRNGARTGTGGH